MKIIGTLILTFSLLKVNGQDINLPLSTEMTIEKSGVYNKNNEIRNVFEITNQADNWSHGISKGRV